MTQGSFLPRANDWGIAEPWNARGRAEKPVEPRSHLWATELGKPPVDNFLRLRGVIPTNPPNERSFRKFDAGNFMEWMVGLVFQRAGIYKEEQKWVSYQYPGLLEVTGRIDFIAGGNPDYDLALSLLKKGDLVERVMRLLAPFSLPEEPLADLREILGMMPVKLPDFFLDDAERVIKYLQGHYPEGLEDTFFEVKSVASGMMDRLEKKPVALPSHRKQLYHYLKAENQPRGRIAYICRDDLRLAEIPVLNPSPMEDEYRHAIEENTGYYEAHKKTDIGEFLIPPDSSDVLKWDYNPAGIEGLPPLAPLVLFEDGKFSKNLGVEYSGYLTMLYGFDAPRAYSDSVKGKVARWNRVLKRMKDGATMTKLNLEAIDEMAREGWDAKKIAEDFAADALGDDEETDA